MDVNELKNMTVDEQRNIYKKLDIDNPKDLKFVQQIAVDLMNKYKDIIIYSHYALSHDYSIMIEAIVKNKDMTEQIPQEYLGIPVKKNVQIMHINIDEKLFTEYKPNGELSNQILDINSSKEAFDLDLYLNVNIDKCINDVVNKSSKLRLSNSGVYNPKYFKDKTYIDLGNFYKLLQISIVNDISATRYSLETIKHYCDYVREKIKIASEKYKPTYQMSLNITPKKIIYEFENFTMHQKNAIDRLTKYLDCFFKTDSINIYNLYVLLDNNNLNDNKHVMKILANIDKYRNFLDIYYLDTIEGMDEDFDCTSPYIKVHPDSSSEICFINNYSIHGTNVEKNIMERYEQFILFMYDTINDFLDYD